MNEDIIEKIAAEINMDEDIVRAASMGERKLTTLYNSLSGAQGCYSVGFGSMLGAAVGLTGMILAHDGPASLHAVSFYTMLSGFVSALSFLAAGSYRSSSIKKEITQAAHDRLIELDRKDRGQNHTPAL